MLHCSLSHAPKTSSSLQNHICIFSLHAYPHISVCQSGVCANKRPWLSLYLVAGPSRASYGDPDVTPANLPSVRLNFSAVIYLERQKHSRRGKHTRQKWFVSLRRESKPRSQLECMCVCVSDAVLWLARLNENDSWDETISLQLLLDCFCVFLKHSAVIYYYIYYK